MIQTLLTRSNIDVSALRTFVRKEIVPSSPDRDREGRFSVEVFSKLHTLGWLQAAIPEDVGGIGATATDLACAVREIAYGSAGIASSFVANTLAMSPVILFGETKLRETLLSQSLALPSLWSFCMTEPDSGTDIHATRALAKRVGNDYVISGKKCFITNANFADHFIVFARTENADPKSPLTAFYVPARSPGITLGKPLDKLGHRDSDTGEIFFDSVRVPAAHRIGGEGEGIQLAFRCLHRSKMLLAAGAVGTCDRALELAADFVGKRIHFGKPLLAIPTIRSQLAQLHTEVEAAWLLTCLAAATWETGDFAIKEASMAKLFAADTAVKVASETLELMGGYGYSKELEIERIFRDSKLYEILEGGSFVQHILISKELYPHERTGRARAA